MSDTNTIGHLPTEKFIPLMVEEIVAYNDRDNLRGISPKLYALHHVDIIDKNHSYQFSIEYCVDRRALTRLMDIPKDTTELTVGARVQLLPGTYFYSKLHGITILGSVFIRMFKEWLLERYSPEEVKRHIVFGDDDLSYTVYC